MSKDMQDAALSPEPLSPAPEPLTDDERSRQPTLDSLLASDCLPSLDLDAARRVASASALKTLSPRNSTTTIPEEPPMSELINKRVKLVGLMAFKNHSSPIGTVISQKDDGRLCVLLDRAHGSHAVFVNHRHVKPIAEDDGASEGEGHGASASRPDSTADGATAAADGPGRAVLASAVSAADQLRSALVSAGEGAHDAIPRLQDATQRGIGDANLPAALAQRPSPASTLDFQTVWPSGEGGHEGTSPKGVTAGSFSRRHAGSDALLPLLSRAVSVLCEMRQRCEGSTRALEMCLDEPLPYGVDQQQRDVRCTAQATALANTLDEALRLQALAWSEAVGGADRAALIPSAQQRLLRVLHIGIRGCRTLEDASRYAERVQVVAYLLGIEQREALERDLDLTRHRLEQPARWEKRNDERELAGLPRLPVPKEFICPLSGERMVQPVVAADGVTYERSAITAWMRSHGMQSPVTGSALEHPRLNPNQSLKLYAYA